MRKIEILNISLVFSFPNTTTRGPHAHPSTAVFAPKSYMLLKSAVDHCLKIESGGCLQGRNGPIATWDVSGAQHMQGLFQNAKNFNGDITNWDVSRIDVMESMFQGTGRFTRDLSKWDVSRVNDMASMFRDSVFGAYSGGRIENWDVSHVIYMESMFKGNPVFNRDLSKWDVSRVQNMRSMFEGATGFRQKLCGPAWVHSTAHKDGMFVQSPGSICGSYVCP